MKKFLRDNRGVTMVELLVAVAMLALIMTPLLRPLLMSLTWTQGASSYGETTSYMENAMEAVKAADVTNMVSGLEYYYNSPSATVEDVTLTEAVAAGSQKYVVTDGTQKIEIVVREPNDTDTDLTDDFWEEYLTELNGSTLSSFTNIDLTLLQTPGTIYDSAGEVKNKDVDEIFYEQLLRKKNLTSITANQLKRTIKINFFDGEELTANYTDSTGADVSHKVGNISYQVEYWYSYAGEDDVVGGKVYEGSITTGTDGVVAVQLVYAPLNNDMATTGNTSNVYEDIEIVYSGHLPVKEGSVPDASGNYDDSDYYQLRLFLIKQKRNTCSIACSGYTAGAEYDSDFECPHSRCDEDYLSYGCNVYLDEYYGGRQGNLQLYSNINVDLYTGKTLTSNPFKFEYMSSTGTTVSMPLAEKLVVDDTTKRFSIVEVEVFESGVSVAKMKSVKLN